MEKSTKYFRILVLLYEKICKGLQKCINFDFILTNIVNILYGLHELVLSVYALFCYGFVRETSYYFNARLLICSLRQYSRLAYNLCDFSKLPIISLREQLRIGD